MAEGGCRRCAYRKRAEGDFLCGRCREDRDIERAQKRRDALDAAAIEEFAAQPERVHNPPICRVRQCVGADVCNLDWFRWHP